MGDIFNMPHKRGDVLLLGLRPNSLILLALCSYFLV